METDFATGDDYRARRDRCDVECDRFERWSRAVARARAISFLVGLTVIVWAQIDDAVPGDILTAFGVVLLVLFGGLIVWHARIDERRHWAAAQRTVNERTLARLVRDWRALPDEPALGADRSSAEDLDLFGHASLMQLLGPATSWGRATLERWLLDGAQPEVVRSRQEAVRELAPQLEFRQALATRGLLAQGFAGSSLAPLVDWAESEPWLLRWPAAVWLVRVSSGATLGLLLGQAFGATTDALWLAPLALNVVTIAVLQLKVNASLDRASAAVDALKQYARLFQLISTSCFEATAMVAEQAVLGGERVPAHVQLQRLERINDFANLRRSAGIFHFPIHALTLWDFHVLERLEQWQRHVGPQVRGWLTALGEVDALGCLAGLQFDNPDWCVPKILDAGAATVRGVALGHPLIPAESRVANDLDVGPPGTFLLVTGSNMSGKSTLLRAIGMNVLLAQAGGPACASSLALPRVTLETSMRVHDSLEDGVSYFMAALRRLRAIVEAVRDAEQDGRRVVYLLDEILQGTNTAERQAATRAIIGALLAHGAIGAVTTHDLGLVDDVELAAASRTVHFSERIGERDGEVTMSFDYRLRPGLATSRNALQLMKMIGLDPDVLKR